MTPAESISSIEGLPANTKGRVTLRESRLSKKGCGSRLRSRARGSGWVSSSSVERLSTIDHSVVCTGSSQSIV